MPELILELNGRTWTLDASRPFILGRDPKGDLVLDDARVSWRHATISWGGDSWVIEDHGSTNGTYIAGQRIRQMEIGPGSAVHLGNPTDGPELTAGGVPTDDSIPQTQIRQQVSSSSSPRSLASSGVPQQRKPDGAAGAPSVYGDRSVTSVYQLALGRVMRIGRALENELVVSDLQVSRHHAEFHAT
ncbi:FHA domain-containing protein, partial [Streptomyces sp. NPDC048489]|uniref:FHA domain-containing protein n=1 Tax=Streptomyces sp. NPDC048489 TaxID=3154504 RepID=UPI003417776F